MAQDPGEVRQAIEEDREALADTVQALVQKADVKQRVRDSLSRNADQLQDKAGDAVSRVRNVTPDQVQSGLRITADSVRQRPLPPAAGGGLLLRPADRAAVGSEGSERRSPVLVKIIHKPAGARGFERATGAWPG